MSPIYSSKIEMFPAKNGDAFLVSCYGELKVNILIDLAYSHTYKNFVRPVLKKMNENNESLELMVVTHIDQDHIAGAITFLEENGNCESPKVIKVKEIWHNSYRHLSISQKEKELNSDDKEMIIRKTDYVDREADIRETVSARQGSRLAGNIYLNEYKWNNAFDGNAISFSKSPISLSKGDVKLTVLSPTNIELKNLEQVWKTELHRTFQGVPLTSDECFDDAVEYVSQYLEPNGIVNYRANTSGTDSLEELSKSQFIEDSDEINASSITFILEHKGKKMLFLGDCPPSIIIRQLGDLFSDTELPVYFDLIKVSHHGSKFNTNTDLLNMIDSRNYLISTNGSGHGHPDIETLARIVTRESSYIRNLYFSYPTQTAISLDREEWKKEYKYEICYANAEESIIVHL